jgi:hypothetical protein
MMQLSFWRVFPEQTLRHFVFADIRVTARMACTPSPKLTSKGVWEVEQ